MLAATVPPAPDTTRYLHRPEGRIAFDVTGQGPLIICAPGMGDLRTVHRFLAADLAASGFRVAQMDLRGHGGSDTTFSTHDDEAAASDLLALIGELGGPAVLVGSSMSAGAAVLAAAQAPDAVRALVLIGPFVRDVPVPWHLRLAMRLGLQRPWGPAVWSRFYASLYPRSTPADLPAHVAAIRTSLARPGAWAAFKATTRTSHRAAEAALGAIRIPTLVVMGTADPDFPDPAGEAAMVAERLDGRVLMVEGAGHYPQAECPELVTPAVLELLTAGR